MFNKPDIKADSVEGVFFLTVVTTGVTFLGVGAGDTFLGVGAGVIFLGLFFGFDTGEIVTGEIVFCMVVVVVFETVGFVVFFTPGNTFVAAVVYDTATNPMMTTIQRIRSTARNVFIMVYRQYRYKINSIPDSLINHVPGRHATEIMR